MASKVDKCPVDPEATRALAALRDLPGASVAVFDTDLRYLLVSGPAAGVPGVEDEELEGRLIADVQPDWWWKSWEALAVAALRGETNSVDLLAADGRSYRLSVGPWRSAAGVGGGVAVFTDVTDRTRALTLAEGLLESAPDATVVVDQSGFIVRVNGHAEELFGYDRGELLAQRIEMLMPAKARAGHVAERSRYSVDPHRRQMGPELQLFARHKNGTEFPVEVSLSPLETEEGLVISSAIRDVTDRKRLERLAGHLASVVQASADAIIGKTVEGIIVSWNPGAENLYGYTPAEAIGQSIAILIPPGHDDELPMLLARLKDGERLQQLETVRRRKDGTIIDVSLTLSPILDAEGRVVGASTIARDISEKKRAELALAEARADIDRFFALSPQLMAVGNVERRLTRVSSAWESILGYKPQEVVGRLITDFIHPDDIEGTLAITGERAAGRPARSYENRYRCKDGSYRWIMWNASTLDGGITLGTGTDVTDRKRLEQALEEARERELADSHAQYRQILDTTPDGIWRLDREGRTDYVNQRMAAMLDYPAEEMIGRSFRDFMEPKWSKFAEDQMTHVRDDGKPAVSEVCLTRKDGQSCWARVSHTALHDSGGAVVGALAIMSDITEAKSQQRELRSTEHVLAGLTSSITEGIFALDRDGQLKFVNPAAERLLGWTAEELAVRFANAKATGERDRGQTLPDGYQRLMSPLSTGEAVRVEDDTFIGKDDREVPVAYSSSPIIVEGQLDGLVVVFTDITGPKTEEKRRRQELEAAAWVGRIQDALDEDRFALYQQPIIDVASREIVGHELLIRMVSRDGEIIAPGRFLPTAEQYGLITDIDLWVTQQACRIAATGREVNFNISGKSLGSKDLLAALSDELTKNCADPALLVCEITETALAADEAVAERFVKELIDLGCGVSLDDFGMGYGGFSYLKHFAFTELKIDMEFGRDLLANAQNQHVVKAIANLAQGFGRKTIAEGIEDINALDLLQQYGVNYAQGYAIGKPEAIDTEPLR